MSFILDALKKSESERHRHSGPVLMDVRIAPPRRRVPVWAWVIAGVLVVNLGVLAWALWRAPQKPEIAAAAVPSAPPPSATAPATAAAATPPSPLPEPTLPQPTPLPAPVSAALPPPQASPASPPAGVMPPGASAAVPPAATADIDVTTLPRVQDLLAAGVTLPPLTLNLHVYDPQPANRYVLLNGRRTRESDYTAEGARVVQITAAGVVVEWRGRRMFLGAGG